MAVQPSAKDFAVLVLAAGASERFGSPKALAVWQDGTLLSNAIAIARSVLENEVLVVTGAYANELRPYLKDTAYIINPNWQDGMGTSLAAGLRFLLKAQPELQGVLVLPVDQPLVRPEFLTEIISKAFEKDCCVLSHNGENVGPPSSIPRRLFPLMLRLDGKQGMKSVLQPSDYIHIAADPDSLADIDYPEDIERLRSKINPANQ